MQKGNLKSLHGKNAIIWKENCVSVEVKVTVLSCAEYHRKEGYTRELQRSVKIVILELLAEERFM